MPRPARRVGRGLDPGHPLVDPGAALGVEAPQVGGAVVGVLVQLAERRGQGDVGPQLARPLAQPPPAVVVAVVPGGLEVPRGPHPSHRPGSVQAQDQGLVEEPRHRAGPVRDQGRAPLGPQQLERLVRVEHDAREDPVHVDVPPVVVVVVRGVLERGARREVRDQSPAVRAQVPRERRDLGRADQHVGVGARPVGAAQRRVERRTLDVQQVDAVLLGQRLDRCVRQPDPRLQVDRHGGHGPEDRSGARSECQTPRS